MDRVVLLATVILVSATSASAQVGRPSPPAPFSFPLRPGYLPYGYPNYPIPGASMPARVPSLVKPYFVPRLLADLERGERREPPVDHYALGRLDFSRGRYDEAVRAWRRAVDQKPRDGNILLQLAQAQFQVGDYAGAAAAVGKALDLLPREKWKSVVVNRGLLYGSPEDYAARLRGLEGARRDRPDEVGLRVLLGYHYLFLGRTADAVRELDRAQALKPGDAAARKLSAAARGEPP